MIGASTSYTAQLTKELKIMETNKNQMRKIWEEVSLTAWKEILTEAGHNKWEIKGRSLKGCCFFQGHADSSPSCYIDVAHGFAKCFGCGKYESNPVKLVSQIIASGWSESLKMLRDKGAKSLPIKLVAQMQEAEIAHTVKSQLASVFNGLLVEAAGDTSGNPRLAFAKPVVEYLKKRHLAIDPGALGWLPIGVLPPWVLIKSKNLAYEEKCYEYIKDWLTADYVGSLVFFYHKSPTEISRFKLRADFLRRDSEVKDIVYIKDEAESDLGFFGLANYSASLGLSKTSGMEAILVEGEFDCLSHLKNFYSTGITNNVVLGMGGASASSPDLLREVAGIDRALIMADSPEANGDRIAKSILKSTSMPSRVFSWPEKVKAKDPDEAIQKFGWATWLSVINEQDTSNLKSVQKKHFPAAYRWLVDASVRELDGIDKDDLEEIKRIVKEDGSCLRDSDVQRMYAIELSKHTTLSVGTILELVVGQDQSEDGLISRILQALRSQFFFIGMDGRSSEAVIKAWHRAKREPREWRIARTGELFGLLSIDIGPAVTWVRENVGVPVFIKKKYSAKGTSTDVPLIEQNAVLKKYIEHALELLSSELPTINSLQEVKAGAHYLNVDLGNGPEHVWCLVNGSEVYLGRFVGGVLNWGLLDGPRVGKYHFNIVRHKWSREIKGCSDLMEGQQYDPRETYSSLYGLIKLGWSFSAGDTDCKYLAAAMMVNALSSALPRQLYTLLNGARGTGKSKLLDLVAGADPRLRLVECTSDVQQAYTAAGFRKDMNNTALGAALDEFEDDRNDSHSQQVRAILRDIRGLTNAPEARITRGNIESSEVTAYILKCQIWACAINYLREEADISRFMQVHTIQMDDKSDPHTVVLDTYTEEQLTSIRRGISVGLFHRVDEFLANLASIRTHYSNPAAMEDLSRKAGTAVPSRFLDGVIITAAMVKLCGGDHISYIEEVICAKIGLLEIITSSTHEKDLMDHILSSKIEHKRPNMEARNTSIRTILSDPQERNRLLEMDCGLSYVEVPGDKGSSISKWLIVMWPDALKNLLKNTPRYSMETPERLKRMGDSSHQAVPYHTARKKVKGLKQFLLAGITANDITVFDVTKTLDDWDNRAND